MYTAIFIAIALLIPLSFATTNPVSHSASPSITIEFDENATVLNASVESASSTTPSPTTGNVSFAPLNDATRQIWVFAVQDILVDGDYSLRYIVEDSHGNVEEQTLIFSVEILPTVATLLHPENTMANNLPFMFAINASKPATCKWDYAATDFDSMQPFTEINETVHAMPEFTFSVIEPEQKKPVFVQCQDITGELSNQHIFNVGFDTTEAVLNGSVKPSAGGLPPLINEQLGSARVEIQSDDATKCKYLLQDAASLVAPLYHSMTPFNDFNESFTTSHIQPLQVIDKQNYQLAVMCENEAGKISQFATPFRVDLSAVPSMNVVNPPTSLNSRTIPFEVRTDKSSTQCLFGTTSSNLVPLTPTDTSNKRFTGQDIVTDDGSYTYLITCTFAGVGDQQSQITFTVDTLAPPVPQLNVNDTQCGLDRLKATLSFEEDPGDISFYNYSIRSGSNEIIIPHTTSSSPQINVPAALTHDERYTWSVVAVDRAGNPSPSVSRTTRALNKSFGLCDKTPPKVNISINQTGDQAIITVGCIDQQGPCRENMLYGFSQLDQECSPTRTGQVNSSLQPIDESAEFCYVIFDENNNNATGQQTINVIKTPSLLELCSDGVQSGTETDVDCGGDCDPCSEGDMCLATTDCIEPFFCHESNNTCVIPSCNDGVHNQQETDIDCGGYCLLQCIFDQGCESDDDCVSQFCAPSTQTCGVPSCTDGAQNQDETDKDCGGSCDPCPDLKSCEQPFDCISNVCHNGVCGEPAPESQTPNAAIPPPTFDNYDDKHDDESTNLAFLFFLIPGILLALCGGTVVGLHYGTGMDVTSRVFSFLGMQPPTLGNSPSGIPSSPPQPYTEYTEVNTPSSQLSSPQPSTKAAPSREELNKEAMAELAQEAAQERRNQVLEQRKLREAEIERQKEQEREHVFDAFGSSDSSSDSTRISSDEKENNLSQASTSATPAQNDARQPIEDVLDRPPQSVDSKQSTQNTPPQLNQPQQKVQLAPQGSYQDGRYMPHQDSRMAGNINTLHKLAEMTGHSPEHVDRLIGRQHVQQSQLHQLLDPVIEKRAQGHVSQDHVHEVVQSVAHLNHVDSTHVHETISRLASRHGLESGEKNAILQKLRQDITRGSS